MNMNEQSLYDSLISRAQQQHSSLIKRQHSDYLAYLDSKIQSLTSELSACKEQIKLLQQQQQ